MCGLIFLRVFVTSIIDGNVDYAVNSNSSSICTIDISGKSNSCLLLIKSKLKIYVLIYTMKGWDDKFSLVVWSICDLSLFLRVSNSIEFIDDDVTLGMAILEIKKAKFWKI